MSDEQITCGKCGKKFPAREVAITNFVEESCPDCSNVIRRTETFSSRDYQANVEGDIAAINRWLDEYSKKAAATIRTELPTGDAKEIWTVSIDFPWHCRVIYKADHLNTVTVRLFSDEHGEIVAANKRKWQLICADYGVQPFGTRHVEVLEHEETVVWGAQQILATATLCPELLPPLLHRLDEALREVSIQFEIS